MVCKRCILASERFQHFFCFGLDFVELPKPLSLRKRAEERATSEEQAPWFLARRSGPAKRFQQRPKLQLWCLGYNPTCVIGQPETLWFQGQQKENQRKSIWGGLHKLKVLGRSMGPKPQAQATRHGCGVDLKGNQKDSHQQRGHNHCFLGLWAWKKQLLGGAFFLSWCFLLFFGVPCFKNTSICPTNCGA